MTKDQVRVKAMALDPTDRETLAEELLLSLTESDQGTIDAAWLAEARRREEAVEAGQLSGSAVDEVIARVQSKAGR